MHKKLVKVTCGIIWQNQKILIARRGREQVHPGKWEFPGGKVKPSESLEACLARELYEELNIQVNVLELWDSVNMEYEDFYIELHPFKCKFIDNPIILREHEQIKWCSIGEMGKLDMTEADRELVQRIKKAGGEPAIREQR